MALVPCTCGGTPELSRSETRLAKREAAETRYSLASAVDHRMGASRKTYELAERDVKLLALDAMEVRCPDCGRFVVYGFEPIALVRQENISDAEWEVHQRRAEEYQATQASAMAENRWNRAVEKLGTLDACCLEANEHRVDPDGQVMVHCATCGRRHYVLEPKV